MTTTTAAAITAELSKAAAALEILRRDAYAAVEAATTATAKRGASVDFNRVCDALDALDAAMLAANTRSARRRA